MKDVSSPALSDLMLETRIEELAAACDIGSKRACAIDQREWFNELLLVQLKGVFSSTDVEAIRQIIAVGHQALLAARKGESIAADHGLTAAKSLVQQAVSLEARRVGESFLSAQEAYFRYLEGEFTKAIGLLQRAFFYDGTLEEISGLRILVMHRVQLLHNLMRIGHRRGLSRDAMFIGCRVLDYLETQGSSALDQLPDPWCRQWPRNLIDVPVELVNQMHAQIAAEQIRTYTSFAANTDRDGIEDLLRHANYGYNSQSALWMEVQLRSMTREVEHAHTAMVELLSRGPYPSLPLWRSAAAQALQTLTEYDEAVESETRNEPQFQPSARGGFWLYRRRPA